MRSGLLLVLGTILSILIVGGFFYGQKQVTQPIGMESHLATPASAPSAPTLATSAPSPTTAPSADPSPASSSTVDLATVDANGLSKATVVIETTQGKIKFKFFPVDAPQTVKRISELIQKGFYNGLIFHRVVPGFVIQGGDPTGTGTGGSGQNIPAEFNERRHIEGTVAMARANDPNSADSQFYISMSRNPHLDHKYTVFGQVVEGMEVVKKIKPGDKMVSVLIQ